MKRVAGLISAFALFTFATLTHAVTSPVGSTPGSFAVSPSGAATYTIPIQVPPGVNGMQPSLSLAYNSQASNGIAGVGWSIDGLSEITRCGATKDRDGYKGGVDLTTNDKFCLDGQRLIAISGAYGGNGAEYRTEIESFSRIYSYGANNIPTHFIVKTKTGQMMEYGNTADSRGYASGNGTVLEWSINKTQDALGNYVQYVYNADSASTGEHRIERVEYTYKSGVALGGVPRQVKFEYESRNDVLVSYFGGQNSTTRRLQRITTLLGAAPIRSYTIAYGYSDTTGRSRPTSVTECAYDSTSSCQVSLASINFSHLPVTAANNEIASGVIDAGYDANRWWTDANGDGIEDYCRLVGNVTAGYRVQCLYSGPNGFGSESSSGVIDAGYDYNRFWVDANGDGTSDYCRLVGNVTAGYRVQCLYTTSTGFGSESSSGVIDAGYDYNRFWVDANGDGTSDYCRLVGNVTAGYRVQCLYTTYTGFGSESSSGVIDAGYDNNRYWVDANGDGLTDFCRLVGNVTAGYRVQCLYSSSSGFGGESTSGVIDAGYDANRYWVDANGDGLADFCRLAGNVTAGYRMLCLYSSSTGFGGEATSGVIDPGYNAGKSWTDGNGDGLADYCRLVGNVTAGYRVQCLYSTASGFGNETTSGVIDPGYEADRLWVDASGDGAGDYCRLVGNVTAGYRLYCLPLLSGRPDLISTVSSSFGPTTTIAYRSASDSSIYTKTTGAVYPVREFQEAHYLVASIQLSNGIGSNKNTASYAYSGMKIHQLGRGNLGFRTMTVTGPDGIKSVTTNNQTFPYVGMPERVDVYRPHSSALLSSTVNNFKCLSGTSTSLNSNPALCAPPAYSPTASYGGTLYLPFVSTSTTSSSDLNGMALPTATNTVNTLDAYGNTLSTTATTTDGYSKISTATFYNDTANWVLGIPVKVVLSNTVPAAFSGTGAAQTQTRTSINVYTLGAGTANYQLKEEVVEPATNTATGSTYAPTYTLGALTLVTGYEYDATYGHRNKVTVSGTGITARSTSTAYVNSTNPGSLNPQIRVTNALGHTETTTYDARFGVPLSLTGPNNLTTTWEYDGFGRKTKELRADNTSTTIALNDCGTPGCYLSSDLGYARYSSTTRSLNTVGTDLSPAVTVYYDILGRELRTESLGFNGGTIYKDTAYDSLGRVKKSSRPYFTTQTAQWTTPTYDALGRAYQITTPDGAVTTTTFNGLTTTVQAPASSDGKLRKRTEVKNSQGQLVTVTDALNNVITYKYDAFGNLTKVINPVPAGITATSNTIATVYDIRGRKTSMTDPDMGTWTYTYNVLGEMLTQKDAKNQTATMTYDVLGRMTKRVEAEGTSTWTYDTAANGKGKLASVTGPTNSYSRSYVYDSKGRPSVVGTNINSVAYNMSVGYDSTTGRVTNVQFPSTISGVPTFAFYNNYNTRGFLDKVSSQPNSAGTVYWQVNGGASLGGMDAEGNLTGAIYGNGVSTTYGYDPIRGLLTDIDSGPNSVVQDDNYTYFTGVPNLASRSSYVTGNSYTETFSYDELNRLLTSTLGGVTKSVTYDSLGNIKSKTGVGTYTYGSSRPHAVTQITGTVNGVVNPTYTYDANGNQYNGAGRTLTYTSFNLPKSVATATITQNYAYDAEHSRIVMTQGSDTTIYINPRWDAGVSFEKETKGGVTEYKHYIYAGSKPVAMHIVSSATPSAPKTRYLHTDHLGSVEAITDEVGNVLERMSYDAWGKRRNANGTDATTQPTSTITRHGFTGHEMVDVFGLVNMNGRWYDPTLGRFMQADPMIQAPGNLQSYNRYAYVLNNPLSYTDPSGYNWISKKWKKFFNKYRGYIAVIVQVVLTAMGCPVCGGFVAGYIATGTLKGAMYGAASALMFGALGQYTSGMGAAAGAATRAVAGGVIGGAMSMAQGGSFRSGFASAALGSLSSGWGGNGAGWTAARIGAGAVAGGLGARAAGGDFDDGARMGAFGAVASEAARAYQAGKSGGVEAARARIVDGNVVVELDSTFFAQSPEVQMGIMIHEQEHIFQLLPYAESGTLGVLRARFDAASDVSIFRRNEVGNARLEYSADTAEIKYLQKALSTVPQNSPSYNQVRSRIDYVVQDAGSRPMW